MLSKLIKLSKAIEELYYAAEQAKNRGYGPKQCELEEKLTGDALEFIDAQLSQLEHPLSQIKRFYK